nr:M28 family peptidase [Pseudomonadota bacterium]
AYTLGAPPLTNGVPVLSITGALAQQLLALIGSPTPPIIHIKVTVVRANVISQNILAESKSGNADNVVMAGAHLDSVDVNSGMIDNGSSSATILEIALKMAKVKPINKLRFAWWTGEEIGLLGSTFYVNHLSTDAKSKIAVYLNYESLGAPNGGRLIMGTATGLTSPGSEVVTQLYKDYFAKLGLGVLVFDPSFQSAVSRSDQFPFIVAGIPIGFIVTGANFPWLAEYSAAMPDLAPSRTIGLNTHPCYHIVCDTLTLDGNLLSDPNFDFNLYEQMSRAAAFAILTYSMSTESINGVRGKGNFSPDINLKLLKSHHDDEE